MTKTKCASAAIPQSNFRNLDEDDEVKCCKNVTTCEICLAILLVLLIFMGVMSFYLGVADLASSPEEAFLCTELPCLKFATEVDEYADVSVDPCESFYGFVCGKFRRDFADEATLVEKQSKRMSKRLEAYVTEPESEDDMEPVKLQKKFFEACLNLEAIDADKDATFWKLIDNIGGWPLALGGAWDEREFTWIKNMAEAKQLGLPFEWFLEIGLYQSDDTNYLQISCPKNCGTLEKQEEREYLDLMIEVAVNMSLSRKFAFLDANGVLQLQRSFAEICTKCKDSKMYLKQISDLETLYPNPKMNWVNFLSNITQQELSRDTEVVYDIEEYILDLNKLLGGTSNRVNANFVVWKLLEYYSPYLSQPMRDLFQEYFDRKVEKNNCDKVEDPRREFCIKETTLRFPYVSQAAIIREHFTEEAQETYLEMATFLKQEIVEIIKSSDSLDEVTKENRTNEVESTEIAMGGVDEIFDDDAINSYLRIGQLNFSSANIIEMLTEKSKAHLEAIFGAIGLENITKHHYIVQKPLEDNKSDKDITEISSIFAEFLMYNFAHSKYLNYPGAGAILSNLLMESHLELWDLSDCKLQPAIEGGLPLTRDDYFNYDIARGAYQKWSEENGEEAPLPGLDYTPNQLFWIKLGTLKCNAELTTTNFDIINEPLRNSRFFAEDFNCPAGSGMNPEKKCKIL